MDEKLWEVVPLCERQLRDISNNDILKNGLYRKCNTYKSGGGYDRLPEILEKRGMPKYSKQFVVQLKGCIMKCPYCYVTPDGIWGDSIPISSKQLINDFLLSEQEIFHLMGGAPALHIENWPSIIKLLPKQFVFHSDLLLLEKLYSNEILKNISQENCIYAVSIKGCSKDHYYENTQIYPNYELLRSNLIRLLNSNANFYLTYTGMSPEEITKFREWINIQDERLYKDSFNIEIIEYLATKE